MGASKRAWGKSLVADQNLQRQPSRAEENKRKGRGPTEGRQGECALGSFYFGNAPSLQKGPSSHKRWVLAELEGNKGEEFTPRDQSQLVGCSWVF